MKGCSALFLFTSFQTHTDTRKQNWEKKTKQFIRIWMMKIWPIWSYHSTHLSAQYVFVIDNNVQNDDIYICNVEEEKNRRNFLLDYYTIETIIIVLITHIFLWHRRTKRSDDNAHEKETTSGDEKKVKINIKIWTESRVKIMSIITQHTARRKTRQSLNLLQTS